MCLTPVALHTHHDMAQPTDQVKASGNLQVVLAQTTSESCHSVSV
jgi:hypothetical protein